MFNDEKYKMGKTFYFYNSLTWKRRTYPIIQGWILQSHNTTNQKLGVLIW
jgi:hypothetical protein